MPGTPFTHTRGDNLSHLPTRQASQKNPPKPGFLTGQGCSTQQFRRQSSICQRKRVSLVMKWGGSTATQDKRRTEKCVASEGILFLFVARSRYPSHKGFLSNKHELFSLPKQARTGLAWVGWRFFGATPSSQKLVLEPAVASANKTCNRWQFSS